MVNIEKTELDGVLIITPKVFKDERGFFLESYNKKKLFEKGIYTEFVQDNHSKSVKGTVRGLHYMKAPGEVKLVRVIRGKVWDVAVDIRHNSPTFGKWIAVELSAENEKQLYIPIGFAHGFCVLSDEAEFVYKCSNYYDPELETGIQFDDPEINIAWPTDHPVVSHRDNQNMSFKEYKENPDW
jgi:dTDP-4-dehydrorhamnose 3,5-epimerase